jgi:hypothetical protein
MCRYETVCLSVATPGGSDFREHIFTVLKVLKLDYVRLKLLPATSILNLNKVHSKTHLKYLFQHGLKSNRGMYKFSTYLGASQNSRPQKDGIQQCHTVHQQILL